MLEESYNVERLISRKEEPESRVSISLSVFFIYLFIYLSLSIFFHMTDRSMAVVPMLFLFRVAL